VKRLQPTRRRSEDARVPTDAAGRLDLRGHLGALTSNPSKSSCYIGRHGLSACWVAAALQFINERDRLDQIR
jgi:hypothetical protein